MSKQNELLGFGGMISGRLPAVNSVGRALDLEGEKVAEERTGNVGARYRSAYRLAGALPGSVAVVISQDGGVRVGESPSTSQDPPPSVEKIGDLTFWAVGVSLLSAIDTPPERYCVACSTPACLLSWLFRKRNNPK